VHVSSSVAAWIAIGAAVIAVVALALLVSARLALRKVLRQQQTLLGGGQQDIVDFAVALQTRIDDLNSAVDVLGTRVGGVDARLDGAVSKTAIVRYDAYENSGGHQSASVALLDAARSGVVLSAIQGRDYARIYIKELDRGRASIALSPEEQEAVDRAMAAS
jgi:Protein of unknown function (DUF4446)